MNAPQAEIISIGTELLLGEIVDTNTRRIALDLRSIGIHLYRTTTVGDNPNRIATTVRDSIKRAEIIITTGGLGPTIDDATREGIAEAVGVSLVFHPELWEEVQARFKSFGKSPTENNRRQAFLPEGARAIQNPVGTAPGFILESDDCVVISLPGVPAEMEHLLIHDVIPYLRRRFRLSETIKIRRIRTAGEGESALSAKISDLEVLPNPTVGFSAHPGRVDIRIAAKAKTEAEADDLIWGLEATIRQRLGSLVYGTDEDTLEGVCLKMLEDRDWRFATVERGTLGKLNSSLSGISDIFVGGKMLEEPTEDDGLESALSEWMEMVDAQAGLALDLSPANGARAVEVIMIHPNNSANFQTTFPSRMTYAEKRAISYALNILRRKLSRG